jgi:hypothetical protein
MRIAYFLQLDVDRYEGVAKKIADKIMIWENLGHSVSLFCVVPDQKDYDAFKGIKNKHYFIDHRLKGIPVNFALDWINGSALYKKLLKNLKESAPDIVYYRKNLFSPVYARINKRFRTVVEINTNETAEFELLARSEWKYKFIQYIYNFSQKKSYKNVDGIVSVTYEIIEAENKQSFKHLVLPNSIPLDKNNFRTSDTLEKKPSLVFIGTPGMPWHGVDILLKIASHTIDQLHFHIIGYTAEELGQAVPKNVSVHGFLQKKKYSEIIRNADIGVGTLALFRKGMEEACPLKIREYIYFGKPVILGYKDTAFINKHIPDWVLELPNDDEFEQKAKRIASFANRLKSSVIDFNEAYQLFDALNFEERRMHFLEEIVNAKN